MHVHKCDKSSALNLHSITPPKFLFDVSPLLICWCNAASYGLFDILAETVHVQRYSQPAFNYATRCLSRPICWCNNIPCCLSDSRMDSSRTQFHKVMPEYDEQSVDHNRFHEYVARKVELLCWPNVSDTSYCIGGYLWVVHMGLISTAIKR